MFGIFGSIKTVLMAVLSAALPVLYLFGRKAGAQKEQQKTLERIAEKEKQRAEFYKTLERKNAEEKANTPNTRDELTDRLREHGL
tara:strand:- start:216 stop:470 length:255 start_codon:yes stop_codon:yes gene_type:complete